MMKIQIALIFVAFLAAVYCAPVNENVDKSALNNDKLVEIPMEFIDDDTEDIYKRSKPRNPYSWMNQAGRYKRARNPYSWMVQANMDDEAPITYGWLRGMAKKSRNPYSWMAEPRRAKNPYSWMNFVN